MKIKKVLLLSFIIFVGIMVSSCTNKAALPKEEYSNKETEEITTDEITTDEIININEIKVRVSGKEKNGELTAEEALKLAIEDLSSYDWMKEESYIVYVEVTGLINSWMWHVLDINGNKYSIEITADTGIVNIYTLGNE